MSNPTELPDLDRLEALARAATPGPWELLPVVDRRISHLCPVDQDKLSLLTVVHQDDTPFGAVYKDSDAEFIAAANPAAVLALIALARRPPVPAQRPTDDELWDSTIRDRDTYHEWADKLADAIASYFGVDIGEHSNQNCPWHEALEAIESAEPARRAQPEGEAPQADGLTRYSMWSNPVGHGMDPSPSGDWVSFDEVRDLLAAQSQGAHVLPSFSVSRYSDTQQRGVLVIFDRRITDDELASVRTALAAKAEAPKPRIIGGQRWSKEAEISEAQIAAQQAAAPAHETIVREGSDLVCTACGTSAPGTPEAPKWHAPGMGEVHSQDHVLMIHCSREIDDPDIDYVADNELAKRVCDALNAAQLDGGQGEGADHVE